MEVTLYKEDGEKWQFLFFNALARNIYGLAKCHACRQKSLAETSDVPLASGLANVSHLIHPYDGQIRDLLMSS